MFVHLSLGRLVSLFPLRLCRSLHFFLSTVESPDVYHSFHAFTSYIYTGLEVYLINFYICFRSVLLIFHSYVTVPSVSAVLVISS